MKTLIPIAILLAAICGPICVASESAAVDMAAEHRSAKPEPFLDRLASLFGGGSNKNDKNGNNGARPNPVYPQRPLGKPYGPPPRPPRRPVLPPPPSQPQIKPQPPKQPTRYQAQPSNSLPTFVSPGGKTSSWFFCNRWR